MRMILIPASLALALSLAACDRSATPADSNASAAAEAGSTDAASVKEAFATFNKAIADRDLAAIRAQYADDAVMVLPDDAPLEGIEAIMADYQAFSTDPAGKFVPGEETTYVSPGSDLAYGQVNYESSYTNPETKAVETGRRYNLTVYKKQPDGSWKVIRDVNTPLPAAG